MSSVTTAHNNATNEEVFTARIRHQLNGLEIFLKSSAIEAAMKLISEGRTVKHSPTPAPRDPPVSRQEEILRASNDRPRSTAPGWGHTDYYKLDVVANGYATALPGFNFGRFDSWGIRELVFSRDPKINLSPLLSVGLGSGVTLTIPTVISDRDISTYISNLEAAVRQFYIDYLKESEKNIRITTESF